jgi:hypothetical protein
MAMTVAFATPDAAVPAVVAADPFLHINELVPLKASAYNRSPAWGVSVVQNSFAGQFPPVQMNKSDKPPV